MSAPGKPSQCRPVAKKVLIVEDDPSLVDLLLLVFEERGYQVRTESNGVGVLDAVRRFRPDVITLDLGLPDLDGQTVLYQLSEDAEGQRIPVVVVSAFADELQPTPQVSAVLGKPFDLSCLLQTIANVIDGKNSQTALADHSLPPHKRARPSR